MCLVLMGWRTVAEHRLILAANRDEFYTRRSEPLQWWRDVPGLLAGRDLGAGTRTPGVWTGLAHAVDRCRFATVTNVRGPGESRADARSRGVLARDFLCAGAHPQAFIERLCADPDGYNGYNLIVSDLTELWWYSNRSAATPRRLAPGYHGVSNNALGPSSATAPQAKVERGLERLRAVVEADPADMDAYFAMLASRTPLPDDQLPTTDASPGVERAVSARFLATTVYGTKSSTVLLIREDGSFRMTERSFGPLGSRAGEVSYAGHIALPP